MSVSIWLLSAGFFAIVSVVGSSACGAFDSTGDDDHPTVTPGADAQSADGGANSTNEAGPGFEQCSAAGAYNLAGCLCTTGGAVNPCYQGVPGAKSACNKPGSQQCAPTTDDGKLRWSTCTGGDGPMVEQCFNDIDDDCDGHIDQGCSCSEDVDLCIGPSGPYDANAYTLFTIPAAPKETETFDLFVVTKDKTLVGPGLLKNDAVCYGGGLAKPCASAGKGCVGWKVAAFHGLKESKGTHKFAAMDPNGDPACSGKKIVEASVVVGQ